MEHSNTTVVPISSGQSLAYTGCFGTYNITSCVRNVLLTLLAFVTFIVCIVKLYKLHSHHHSLPNQYIIFYSGLVQCVFCAVHWIYWPVSAILYVTEFLKIACQGIIVCNFHFLLAMRMCGKEEKLKRISQIVAVFVVIFVLVVAVFGLGKMENEDIQCFAPEWLILSVTEFLVVQVFFLSGVIISRELRKVRMNEEDRNTQNRDLWGIIFVFEGSAVASLVHDIVMSITGPENNCQGIFLHNKAAYTAVYITVKIIRWLLPLWAMAIVFDTENNELQPSEYTAPVYATISSSGTFRSEFRPRGSSFHYKHLRNEEQSPNMLVHPGLMARSKSMPNKYGTINETENPTPSV